MYFDIRHADKVNEDTERVRREWITNITHDLKTPLSPIKGYAELLTDSSNLTGETSKEYGIYESIAETGANGKHGG